MENAVSIFALAAISVSVRTLAATLSTGVQIPAGGVPVNGGGHQYTTRTEKRPTVIADEAAAPAAAAEAAAPAAAAAAAPAAAPAESK